MEGCRLTVYTLAFSMITIFILSFYLNNQEILSPAVVFTAPFSIATIDLIYNIEKWQVDLQMNTFWVIIGGTLVFVIACQLCRLIGYGIRRQRQLPIRRRENSYKETPIVVPKLNYYIFAGVQIITFLLCLVAVIKIARRYGASGTISMMIAGYKNLKTFTTENISLGKVNNLLYDFCYASGYVWFYIVAKNYTITKRVEKLALINLLLSVAISLEKGSRGGAVALICSGAAMFILFWQRSSRKGRLSFKQLLGVIIVAAVVVGTFQKAGELVGRVSTADFEGYLAVYLSAPIRNLDYFLRKPLSAPDVFGKMTFVRMINYLGGKLDIPSWVYELDLPPLHANGYVTGNVYTTFYAYLYDFGYIGVPIMMAIMGGISQIIYSKAKKIRYTRHTIDLWGVVYCYIFFSIAFSFFSNKFYEGIVSIQFVKYLFYWLLIRYYVERLRFKIR